MTRFFGLLLVAGCAPGVNWAPAPENTAAAIVADGRGSIRAYDAREALTLTFENEAVEVAYYERPLEVLGLPAGPIETSDDGVPLDTPAAIYERDARSGDWVRRGTLGPLLRDVRITAIQQDGCVAFEQRAPELDAVALRFMVRDDDVVLIGNTRGEVFAIDASLGDPTSISVRVNGGPAPILSIGRRVGGPMPYLFGARDGSIWKGRFDSEERALSLEFVTTANVDGPITRIAGTLETIDIHVLINGGNELSEPATWSRFVDGRWEKLDELPQMPRFSHFDLLYRSANEVYATALVPGTSVRRFDGQSVVTEDSPALISVAHTENLGVVGGGYAGVHHRKDGKWPLLFPVENEAFPDEPPHAFLDYPGGAVMVGKSFLSQVFGEQICPTTYLWPSFRFSFVERFGDVVIAGTNGRPESAPLSYLVPR